MKRRRWSHVDWLLVAGVVWLGALFTRGLCGPGWRLPFNFGFGELAVLLLIAVILSRSPALWRADVTTTLRPFQPEDYAAARALWLAAEGVGLGPGDSEEEVRAYLARNPSLSLVAVDGEVMVGAALCGHDGRRGFIYHLAVARTHRRQGLGREIVARCLAALADAGIRRGQVSVYATNAPAKAFWASVGGDLRADLSVFTIPLDGPASR